MLISRISYSATERPAESRFRDNSNDIMNTISIDCNLFGICVGLSWATPFNMSY